ncbi:MAG: metalloregulator ArsR/SmtB family transcription factor [Pseudolysinimonas sp.]
MADSARSSADAFDALADVQRRSILSLLGVAPHSVQELANELPISRPAVSRHLRVLAETGLVREERVGTRHIFSLQQEGLFAVQAYLERVWGDVASRFTLFAENTGTQKPDAEVPGSKQE